MGKVGANSLVLGYLFHPLWIDLSAVQIIFQLAYFKIEFHPRWSRSPLHRHDNIRQLAHCQL
jgi:hypothetical protein